MTIPEPADPAARTGAPPPEPALPPPTGRLRLRALRGDDAGFLVDLLNQPDFLRHIGDRGVRTPAQALAWLRDGPWAGYARHGHGLLAVEPRAGGAPMGICGLLLREGLPAPDLGLPCFRSTKAGAMPTRRPPRCSATRVACWASAGCWRSSRRATYARWR